MKSQNDKVLTERVFASTIKRLSNQFASKEDLKNALKAYATKEDLKNALKAYATKEDLKNELKAYATKDDLENGFREITADISKLFYEKMDKVLERQDQLLGKFENWEIENSIGATILAKCNQN